MVQFCDRSAATGAERGIRLRALTVYPWHTGRLSRPLRLLVISDLHDADYRDLLPMLPLADALLMPGDLVNRYRQSYHRAVEFVAIASQQMPTFVGIGNHEMRLKDFDGFRLALDHTQAQLMMNTYLCWDGLVVGCWYRPDQYDQPDMLSDMEAEPGVKVLMCHRPEDYIHYLRGSRVDLVLSGHAHGGQIRLGGRGLYAPGQGFFPRYTHGVADGRMIISAGASNPSPVPRIGNPREVLLIELD